MYWCTMTDDELIKSLSEDMKAKTASLLDILKMPIVAYPASGAAIGLAMTALGNRKGKDPSKTVAQEEIEGKIEHAQAVREIMKKKGKTPGFLEDFVEAKLRTAKDMADLAANHPGKAAAKNATIMAALGAGVPIIQNVAKIYKFL